MFLKLSFIISILLGSLSCLKKDNFRDVEDFEATDKIFNQLDPLLGYAHNTNLQLTDNSNNPLIGFSHPDLKKLKNGFAVLEHVLDTEPLNIAIVGSSTSDPYLYGGNWGFQLHLLMKEKKISHRIYNGAVSGYNSTQVLLKLIRDVFLLDKIHIVIFMGPGIDFTPKFGDIVEKHPSLNPVVKHNYELLYKVKSEKEAKEKPISGRLKEFLRPYINAEKADIQLGVENSDYFQNAVQNVKYMNAISKINSAKFLNILDVLPENDSQKISIPKKKSKDADFEVEGRQFIKRFSENLRELKFTYLLQGVPKDKKIFYDLAHVNEEGSKWIALEIYKILKSDYLKE